MQVSKSLKTSMRVPPGGHGLKSTNKIILALSIFQTYPPWEKAAGKMPSVFTIRLVNNQPHEKQWLGALHISSRFRLQIQVPDPGGDTN